MKSECQHSVVDVRLERLADCDHPRELARVRVGDREIIEGPAFVSTDGEPEVCEFCIARMLPQEDKIGSVGSVSRQDQVASHYRSRAFLGRKENCPGEMSACCRDVSPHQHQY
jgi:hypothetical protein